MVYSNKNSVVTVIGGGMAGCEAACMIARCGHPVTLYEMRPKRFSPAHKTQALGELVCSNSLGADTEDSAPGLLKMEMRKLGSVVLEAAENSKVPAGRALAVDRDQFSEFVTQTIAKEPLIRVVREELTEIPRHGLVVIATGPLTSDALAKDLTKRMGSHTLYFYDSISPIVTAESIDYSKAYFASRYQAEREDYLNCPMDRNLYENFVSEIQKAEKVPVRSFEAVRCFEACLPIEVLAERGMKTLAFGPMKPVGLNDPRTGKRPYAVVQLRRENNPTTLYNLVGFQTRMKWGEQKRIFRMIPGLEKAEFVRLGSMHRNTYLNSPNLLNKDLSLKSDTSVFIAGQITGVEGYVESAAMGQWAGLVAVARLRNIQNISFPPPETAFGSLVQAITTRPPHGVFSPMNINFGLLPPLPSSIKEKEARRRQMVARALSCASSWRKQWADLLTTQVTSTSSQVEPFGFSHDTAYA